jgi:pullulanase/glycogen debranching enzyme
MPDRVRMNTLCLAIVAFGQGPMFWHAGTDVLRSKSLDRNSFDSGDWFNRVDWTGASSAFGSGLPPAAENHQRWELQRPLLANAALVPGPADIAASRAAALDLLRIRSSSRLFRLGSAARVIERVSFPHGGSAQPRGVIVMVLSDSVGSSVGSSGGSSVSDAVDDTSGDLDPERERIVVVFNATPWWQSVALPDAGSLVLSRGPGGNRAPDLQPTP